MKYLSHFFLSLIAGLILWGCQASGDAQDTAKNTTDTFQIQKGTNIAHWLSQSDRRGEARKNFFRQKDVKYLADLDFDHLRIPIDEEQMFDEQGNKKSPLATAADFCNFNFLKFQQLTFQRFGTTHNFQNFFGDGSLSCPVIS